MSKIEVMALLEQFAGNQVTMKDAADKIEALYHSAEDRANLFDLIIDAPCYISFFTGQDGQGAAIRQTLVVADKDHNDNVLYNMAMRKAKKLGASSWQVFKPVGVCHNVDYGRYGDESRLDFIDNYADFVKPPKAKHE